MGSQLSYRLSLRSRRLCDRRARSVVRSNIVNWLGAVIALIAGIGGVGLGAMLSRRNERRAQAERLLVEALNDAVRAIASVAGGQGPEAQRLYAAAVSRVALHGSPTVITAFRRFQDDATTVTDEGRNRLLEAIRAARIELGHRAANDEDLWVLLFGATS
jgi:type II secretory pathway pseudopilin PulG